MATKNNPGAFDCYANAEPDEPMFVLLARDELAPHVTRIWAMLRDNSPVSILQNEIVKARQAANKKRPIDSLKFKEAIDCAYSMEEWLKARR